MLGRLEALIQLIFYTMVPIVGVICLVLTISAPNVLMVVLTGMYACLSLFMWLRKVEYDSKILNAIRIEEAPIHITQLLSETTNRGVLINQLIIKTIAENPRISQTDLHRELPIPEEMCPTKERVRQYTLYLENEKIVRDMASEVREVKKRVYVLTKRGEWCLLAIRKYYPKYYVFFLVRVILRTRWRRKLPLFDSIEG